MQELLGDGSRGVVSDFRYGHALRENLRWIKADTGQYMPIVSYDNAANAMSRQGFKVERGQIKNLLLVRSQAIKEKNADGKIVRTWTRAEEPAVVSTLATGASLAGIVDVPLSALPDYGVVALGAQAAQVEDADFDFSGTAGRREVSSSAFSSFSASCTQ